MPNFRSGDPFRNGEPDHEVTEEVEDGADGEHHPRRRHLVDEPREDADVRAQVLKEAQQVQCRLVVPQNLLDFARVEPEHVGGSGRRHDQ